MSAQPDRKKTCVHLLLIIMLYMCVINSKGLLLLGKELWYTYIDCKMAHAPVQTDRSLKIF